MAEEELNQTEEPAEALMKTLLLWFEEKKEES